MIFDKKFYYVLTALFLIGIISYLDFITGYEIYFSIFYTIPIIIVTWYINFKTGVIFCLISAFMWFFVDYLTGHKYQHWSINYWNGVVEFIFYLMIAYLVYRVKTLLDREKELVKINLDLISVVSHEFNNLLTTIHLATTLLKESEININKERLKFYSIIEQNYTLLRDYIRMLLNKSRIESGRIKLNLTRVEIRKLIKEVLFSLQPLILEKNLKIATDFPSKIIPVECDGDIIELVLSNLISNAIKYSNPGGVIKISIEKKGDWVEVAVEDNGIGIKKDDIENITKGFYRTDEGKKHAKGFGIGLKMVKEFLELHGSDIKIESEEGKGSRFSFQLHVYKE